MTGTVVSNKMEKALTVFVYRTKVHKKYNKRFKVRKKFTVACSDSGQFAPGQMVDITPCRPVSKTIRFKVVE